MKKSGIEQEALTLGLTVLVNMPYHSYNKSQSVEVNSDTQTLTTVIIVSQFMSV